MSAGRSEMQRVPQGEEGAFDAYRAALRAFVARRIDNPSEVDDLVQEACARLVASARERTVDEPQAYLFRIAANLIADRHRRALPVVPLGPEIHPPVRPVQEDRRRVADLQSALEGALAELSPRCREVFVMRRFDERGTGEIARELGISPRMVQKHLNHAVAHLYDRLAHLMERGA
ncbi:RNA polymerase sigma-70 factor (ECF subfamily) [Sphingomonas kyeonggiensis]|uniref:RNA polymerase sigma-70 factor (ECF subfamily) n=1 Tax=Sphingomonas kyeonggiensis TaxID=1268553 RepID=A0A7W7NQY4_9SPHN|nr:RNA polymerase sigma factor [Sphingomonas kyeonggiensis]MBB4838715.1 RNA polymerase sigma-70 factor (ECF subfamily) [Sphingomonas kyeonggiensis]